VRTVQCWAKKCKHGKPGRADLCDKPATATDKCQESRSAMSAGKVMAIEWSTVE